MKKLILLVLGFAVFGFTGCEVNKYTTFDMDFTTSITIPASSGINLPFDLLTSEMTTNSSTTFGTQNTSKELIQEITLKSMSLDITMPGDRDFDFLEELHIYIQAEGLSDLKIASKTNIPEDVDQLDLDVNANDLKEYIKKDKFKLRIEATTDEFLDDSVEIDVESIFFVDAEILGV